MNEIFILLLLVLLAGFSSASSNSIVTAPHPTTGSRLRVYVSRVPLAMKVSGVSALRALTSNALFLIPIGVVGAAYNKPETISKVVTSGFKWGLRMSTYGATLAGSEQFCRTVRGVDDIYNRMIGSGISSAIGKREQGILGAAQGFVTGAAFIFALDRFIMPPSSVITQNPSEEVSTENTSGAIRKWIPNKYSNPFKFR